MPHQRVLDHFGAHFLEVFDVDDMLSDSSERLTFMEDDLFSVWEQLCVPSEVHCLGPSPWDEQELNKGWQ